MIDVLDSTQPMIDVLDSEQSIRIRGRFQKLGTLPLL